MHGADPQPLSPALDNDECALDNDDEEPACEGGRCINTVGSYHCTCEAPLVLDGSRRRCVTNESQSLGNPAPRLLPRPQLVPQPRPTRGRVPCLSGLALPCSNFIYLFSVFIIFL